MGFPICVMCTVLSGTAASMEQSASSLFLQSCWTWDTHWSRYFGLMRCRFVRNRCQHGELCQRRKGKLQISNHLRITEGRFRCMPLIYKSADPRACKNSSKASLSAYWSLSWVWMTGEEWWTGLRNTLALKLSATAAGRTLHTWHCCWLRQAISHITYLCDTLWFLPPSTMSLIHLMDRGVSYPHGRSSTWSKHLMWCSVLWTERSWAGLSTLQLLEDILSQMPSLIFRLHGQISRNPVQMAAWRKMWSECSHSYGGYEKPVVLKVV